MRRIARWLGQLFLAAFTLFAIGYLVLAFSMA